MKLVTVLMLTALPLYCYAGICCETLEKVINTSVYPNLNVTESINNIQELIPDEETEKALTFIKECYLRQSEQTLEKVREIQQAIYGSARCARTDFHTTTEIVQKPTAHG